MKHTYIEDFKSWKEDFSYYEDIAVRFSETDMFGHLNNTVPFIYFEQVRIGFMRDVDIFEKSDMLNVSVVPVVADLQCDFLGQIFFGDTVRVFAKIARVGSASIDIHYMGVVRDKVVLTARGTIVKMNVQTGKSEKWTEEQLLKFQ